MPKTITKVPIFALGVDKRTEPFNEQWFDEVALPTFMADKNNGYKPVAHIGHTDPKGDTAERPRVAFLDNLCRVGKQVFADLADIPDIAVSAIEQNLFPNRSVEIRADGKGFHSLALLGATEPHFKLDQTPFIEGHFKALPEDGPRTVIQFDAAEMSLSDAIQVQDKQEEAWRVDSALWSKLYDIKNSESMTAEEKKAAIDEALREYVGLAAEIQKDIVDITDGGDQFKAVIPAALEKQFAAREAALLERENKLLEAEFAHCKLASPVIKNFVALRPHLDDSKPALRFKSAGQECDITPRKAFEEFIRDLVRRFEAGTLFAVTETVPAGANLTDDPSADSQEVRISAETKAIEKFMADNNIGNFADARRAFLQTAEGQRFRASA